MRHPEAHPLHSEFVNPPHEFGMIPFWLLNDDLDEAELLRQIREFHAIGFGGFVPHPRLGLSHRIGYLTDEYFRLVRLTVEEAARLGMKVILYDEGSYPSGSAAGQVVAENPEYAARCLFAQHNTITGPARGYWRPNPGRALNDRLVCVVQARETAPGVLDPESLTLLPVDEHELVRYDVPEGQWRLVAVWNGFSGGTIRGVFADHEDGHATAPPAGDLMNPEAVACFLRLTHDRYYQHLREHFGSTIIGMFTDEPCPMGRGPRRGPKPQPYTEGFLDYLLIHWDEDVRRWLPALWLDCGPRTEAFRQAYDQTVHQRVEEVFYAGQSRWCAEHGIALTGHPERSDQMGMLRYFQWPGQDMVWRYVEPGQPTALEGAHSTAPKAAASAAALAGARRNLTESLGAYGWHLTLDEAKWLLDWHLARGTNLINLHACFYSVRGRRAFESEPDLFLHNAWGRHFGILAHYARRLSWLLTDGEEVCAVAVATDANHLAYTAAAELFRNQIDFLYVDRDALDTAPVEDGSITIGARRFQAVVFDPPGAAASLDAFRSAGGTVLDQWQPGELANPLRAALGRDVDWPDTPDLRALHYRKEGRDFYLLVNEGEAAIEGDLSLAVAGGLELWDPMDGSTRPWPGRVENGRLHTQLRLERRQALVLAVDPQGTPDADAPLPPVPGDALLALEGPWSATDTDGRPIDAPCPGDWAQARAWETFSGTLAFETEFALPDAAVGGPLFLDLGRVGDIAEVFLNGERVGVRAWAPHVLEITGRCRAGQNLLQVRVTNSSANTYNGLQMPSGLMGPVAIRTAR